MLTFTNTAFASTLGISITNILDLRAYAQMCWIHARRVVARMHNHLVVGNRTVMQLKGKPMR